MRFTAPVNRKVWSTMIFRFLRSASSISSSPWAVVQVNGFSTNTCLPFSSAALASSKCVQTGVTTATASTSGEVSNSWQSLVVCISGKACRTRCSDFELLSQTATTREPSCPWKLRTMFGPQ